HAHRSLAHDRDVLVDVLLLAAEPTHDLEPQKIDPQRPQIGLSRCTDRDLLHAEDSERTIGSRHVGDHSRGSAAATSPRGPIDLRCTALPVVAQKTVAGLAPRATRASGFDTARCQGKAKA